MPGKYSTSERTLKRFPPQPQEHQAGLVSTQAIRGALEPWALDAESRRLCLFYKRSLSHKVRILVGDDVHVAVKRDRFIAISDKHVANPDNVEVSRHASPRGFYKHRVLTGAGWKDVYENAKTGEFAMGGRGRRVPWELTFDPPPPILSVMRVKVPAQAELIDRPIVPEPRRTESRRHVTTEDLQPTASPGRPLDPWSALGRDHFGSTLKFIGGGRS